MPIALVISGNFLKNIMAINIDKYLAPHVNALNVRSTRARLLADNLANADTPNYKAKDIDFRSVLQQASQKNGFRQATTHQAHIPLQQGIAAGTVQYRVPLQASLDGNTVDPEVENGKFADNAVRYQASLQFLSKRISGLIRTLRDE